MAYGKVLTDVIQSSTAGTPPQFNDGNGTQIGTLCRAWVNFNGTTSPGTIRAAFNVGSVTKNGTGDYTINFTTALSDINYSVSVGVTPTQAPNGCLPQVFSDGTLWGQQAPTTSAFRMITPGINSVLYDNARVCVSVFR